MPRVGQAENQRRRYAGVFCPSVGGSMASVQPLAAVALAVVDGEASAVKTLLIPPSPRAITHNNRAEHEGDLPMTSPAER